jgi:hypothetical protein
VFENLGDQVGISWDVDYQLFYEFRRAFELRDIEISGFKPEEVKPTLAIPEKTRKRLRYFVDTLMKWYGKIEVEQLEKRMSRMEDFKGLTVDDVLTIHAGVEIVEDGGKRFITTKEAQT